jgi:hypothetical protein
MIAHIEKKNQGERLRETAWVGQLFYLYKRGCLGGILGAYSISLATISVLCDDFRW